MIGTLRSLRDAWLDRAIERELLVGLRPRRRARLHERLRRDPRARDRYDRAVEALRVLEGDVDVAPSELDLVGRWIADDLGLPRPAAAPRRAWPAVFATLAAALVLLLASPLRDPDALRPWVGDDGWQARGGAGEPGLALEALCGPDEPDDTARRVRVRDCSLSDLLGLAYRVPAGTRGQLTVFGIDAQGDAMFYVPTPSDPAGVSIDPGRFRALPLAVRLRVNHAPGSLRIYGLVAPSVATAHEVQALVEQLAPLPAAAPGDPPWTTRVAPESLARLCADASPSSPARASTSRCLAAELHLSLRPD
jgi:hypothetical protein